MCCVKMVYPIFKKNITMVHNLQFLYQDNAIKINSEAK